MQKPVSATRQEKLSTLVKEAWRYDIRFPRSRQLKTHTDRHRHSIRVLIYIIDYVYINWMKICHFHALQNSSLTSWSNQEYSKSWSLWHVLQIFWFAHIGISRRCDFQVGIRLRILYLLGGALYMKVQRRKLLLVIKQLSWYIVFCVGG